MENPPIISRRLLMTTTMISTTSSVALITYLTQLKHVAIYTSLGWSLPQWAHVGLIMRPGPYGKPQKLSKRDEAASLLNYKNKEYNPEAILSWCLA